MRGGEPLPDGRVEWRCMIMPGQLESGLCKHGPKDSDNASIKPKVITLERNHQPLNFPLT